MRATRFDNFIKVVKSNQIDVMVHHLYGLSYEEACVIDKDLKEWDFKRFNVLGASSSKNNIFKK
jgi:hypothetical protein